jgi:hypothetical protein
MRARHISAIIIHINIVDYCGMPINIYYPLPWQAIVVNSMMGDISFWHEYPSKNRNVNVDININARAQRCPSIIIVIRTPANPSRAPFMSWNPNPAIIIVKSPAAIVKRCPSPIVIRNPGISILSYYPMPPGSIRLKSGFYLRNPNPPKIAVINPSPIRSQICIKIV